MTAPLTVRKKLCTERKGVQTAASKMCHPSLLRSVRAHRGVEGNDGKLRLLYEARHILCALEGEGEIQHLRNLSWTCNTASERRSCKPFVLLQ